MSAVQRKQPYIVLISRVDETESHLYSLLAEGQFHAEHRAWAAFRSEYGASDVKDWRVVGFQPRFADQPAYVARVDREQS